MKMSGYRGVLSKQRLSWFLVVLWINVFIQRSTCLDDEMQTSNPGLPTVTVRGFLNFRTTVDGTVIVFTPISKPQPHTSVKVTTEPSLTDEHNTLSTNNNAILQHSNSLESKDAIPVNNIQDLTFTQSPAVLDPLKPEFEDLVQKEKETFLHHISDNAVLPSTIQTDNNLLTDLNKKLVSSHNQYPTGLVTVLDGTHVEDDKTTIFETKVMGTYIDGKYAQILQSTSKIIAPTIVVTPSHLSLSTTSMASTNESPSASIFSDTVSTTQSSILLSAVNEITTPSSSDTMDIVSKSSTTNELPKNSNTMILQSSFQVPEITVKPSTSKPTQSLESIRTNTFSKHVPSTHVRQPMTIHSFDTDDSMLQSSKHLRTSSTRIRFIAPKRQSPTVRLNRFKVRLTLRQNSTDGFELTTPPEEDELEDEEHSKEEEDPMAELSVDVFDPASFVYQETTITSEVTLHVGRRKSIRTLTITTSVPRRISPTDFDGMAMTQSLHEVEDDHEAQENAPATHSVVTRTYTTTERTQSTSLVLVHDGTTTSLHTLTESFFIMKIITAYRTLPPGGVTVLAPTATDTLHTPSEISATTLDIAANDQSSIIQALQDQQTAETIPEIITEAPLPTPAIIAQNVNKGNTNPLLSFGHALSNNPLAAVYLGLQQLNAQMTLYSTVTHTSTYVATDTIYSTKTIRFYDGRSTKFRRTSEPISVTKRTVTSIVTSVQPYINTQAYQQQQQLQKLIGATQQLPINQPRYSTLTSVYTTSTTATSLSTRIYTLIYNGFSTKFRTVTSTKLYPTVLTVTSTKEVPIAPTQPPILPFAYPYPAA